MQMNEPMPRAAQHRAMLQSSAVSGAGFVTYLPLVLVLGFLSVLFFLFLIWPINWPIYGFDQWAMLIGYVVLCFAVLSGGFLRGSRTINYVRDALPGTRQFILYGGIAAAVVLFPSSYLYTGRWPWQVFEALQNQNAAYQSLQDTLMETAGQRGPVALLRALVEPFAFAVVPLGILRWNQLSWRHRVAVFAAAGSTLTFSILRGTDKEFGDLFIVIGSAVLILIGRAARTRGFGQIVKQYWKPALGVLLFLYIAAGLFTSRKGERVGGYENRQLVCANDTRICADIDAPGVSWLPLDQRFGLSVFIVSASQGFYGLELAMEKDFQSTYGFGHSTSAMAVYKLLTGDETLERRSYTYRNGDDGWSQEHFWSSLIVSIANDVGFFGALIVLALIGLLWGRSWQDAIGADSDPAAVIFCWLMIMLFYLSANNHVLASYDGYTIAALWIYLWTHARKRRRSDARPAA